MRAYKQIIRLSVIPTNNLNAQMSEVYVLRDLVRKAELSTQRARRKPRIKIARS